MFLNKQYLGVKKWQNKLKDYQTTACGLLDNFTSNYTFSLYSILNKNQFECSRQL